MVAVQTQEVFDGLAVTTYRQRRRHSRAQLAEDSECSTEMVRSVECGRVLPSVGLLIRLAAALRVPVGALFRKADAA